MRILTFSLLCFVSGFAWSQPYQSPKLLFEEDFTDGQFNGFGSGTNGSAWQLAGFAKFDTTINRSFQKAALRKIADGSGQGWDALVLWKFNGGEAVLFDKKDDVVALKFKAFSDAAGARISPDFGVEVAMLENKVGAPFGHDLSFEVAQVWLRNGQSEGPLQLDANVENTNAVFLNGTTRSHHDVAGGKETAATMDSAYMSEVIWRNRYGTGTSNIEVWGKINSADFNVTQEMKSSTPPINPDYLAFNNVQIALFDKCPACTTDTRVLLRNGTTVQNAQLGIAYCKLGITKVSDFNQDYIIDATDSDTLAANMGSNTGATIKKGDATNNGKVNISDAAPIVGFWSGATPANATALATYNPANGEIKLSLTNISYFKIVSSSNQLSGSAPDFSLFNPKLFTDTDSVLGAYTDGSWTFTEQSIGTVATAGVNVNDLKIWVNYKGSGLNQGILLDFGQELVTELNGLKRNGSIFHLDGNAFSVSPIDEKVVLQVTNALGQTIFFWEGEMDRLPSNISTQGSGFKTLRLISADQKRIFGIKKYIPVR